MLEREFHEKQEVENRAKEKAYKFSERQYNLEQLRSIALFESKMDEVRKYSEQLDSNKADVFKHWKDYLEAKLEMAKVQKRYLLAKDSIKHAGMELKIFENIYDEEIQNAGIELANHLNKGP